MQWCVSPGVHEACRHTLNMDHHWLDVAANGKWGDGQLARVAVKVRLCGKQWPLKLGLFNTSGGKHINHIIGIHGPRAFISLEANMCDKP